MWTVRSYYDGGLDGAALLSAAANITASPTSVTWGRPMTIAVWAALIVGAAGAIAGIAAIPSGPNRRFLVGICVAALAGAFLLAVIAGVINDKPVGSEAA